MSARRSAAIRTARRVDRFTYAIRNIVAEAKKVEQAGTRSGISTSAIRISSAFVTPPHLIDAVERAMRDGHNGYTPSAGILEAREAVAADFAARGVPVSPDRVLITSGTSEGIELALTAIVDEGESVLVPSPTYPLYTAVLAKIGAEPSVLPHRSGQSAGCRISTTSAALITPAHARAGRHRSEQSDRRDLSGRSAARVDRDRRARTAW